jgi:hypothetical protein
MAVVVIVNLGRAIAQAVSRWLPTAAARVHRAGPGSVPGQVMRDLWWTKRHKGRFSPSTSVSPANPHSTDCSMLIIIYHSGAGTIGQQWPTYQVDSPHPEKLKKKGILVAM